MQHNYILKNDEIQTIRTLRYGMTALDRFSCDSNIPSIEVIVKFEHRNDVKLKIESSRLNLEAIDFITESIVDKSNKFSEMTSDQFIEFLDNIISLSEDAHSRVIRRITKLASEKNIQNLVDRLYRIKDVRHLEVIYELISNDKYCSAILRDRLVQDQDAMEVVADLLMKGYDPKELQRILSTVQRNYSLRTELILLVLSRSNKKSAARLKEVCMTEKIEISTIDLPRLYGILRLSKFEQIDLGQLIRRDFSLDQLYQIEAAYRKDINIFKYLDYFEAKHYLKIRLTEAAIIHDRKEVLSQINYLKENEYLSFPLLLEFIKSDAYNEKALNRDISDKDANRVMRSFLAINTF